MRRRQRSTNRTALILSLLCWGSFACFIVLSDSFSRFCREFLRLAGKTGGNG